VALDKGLLNYESTNGYVERLVSAASSENRRTTIFSTSVAGKKVSIDPAKSLFGFMHRLWFALEMHSLHPGFDIARTLPMNSEV
jgi:hypothetical protein